MEENDSVGPIASTLLQELRTLKDKFKDEDEEYPHESPYQHLEKSAVLQESRIFHDSSVVTQNPRKCCQMITKLLFLSVKGETFTSNEITDVFFGVTKLFQSQDPSLRRMMYLFIKEIAETCNPDDVIIVTSSLTKDMNTGEDLFRANSMRVLARIIDATMLGAIERYIKQAIVDRNPFVASSALMTGLSLFDACPEIIRRWVNEVQEAVNSSVEMVQFHALSLLYKIRQHDRLAVSKIVQQLSRGNLRSPLATCLLIRYTTSLLREEYIQNIATNSQPSSTAKASYQFLEICLRHKSDMVIFEAAKAICSLPGADKGDITPAVTVLQLSLSSNKPTRRFAAMKVLSEVASRHPLVVSKCNEDIEGLLNDSNRSIATLAITTLLKTGTESNIDRLLKQISSFMSEIGDEFKVVIVDAIRELCIKYPKKYRAMIGFLATFLREEGEFEFKRAIVDSIVELMNLIPESQETSLLHLCEFIEDCEFSELIIQIMSIISSVGPSTPSPSRYVRFVFNRLILENSTVRAAAVTTLSNIACRVPELRPSILVLLERCLDDENDEVRDRSVIAIEAIRVSKDDNELSYLLDDPLPMSFSQLETSLRMFSGHIQNDPSILNKPVNFSSLPIVAETTVQTAAATTTTSSSAKKASVAPTVAAPPVESVDPAENVYKQPQFKHLGRAFHSTPPVPLTETEMEYTVSCVKHIFMEHVVLEFKVQNTLDNLLLRNVSIKTEIENEDIYTFESLVPIPELKYGVVASTFVCLKRQEGFDSCNIECELNFTLIDIDPISGEILVNKSYEEDFRLEPLTINTSDYMIPLQVGDFRRSWETLGSDNEVMEKFALQFKRYEDGIKAIIDFLGMAPVDNTNIPSPDSAVTLKPHVLHLSGVFLGNIHVLVRGQLALDNVNGLVFKMVVRSDNADVSRIVADCIK